MALNFEEMKPLEETPGGDLTKAFESNNTNGFSDFLQFESIIQEIELKPEEVEELIYTVQQSKLNKYVGFIHRGCFKTLFAKARKTMIETMHNQL